MKTVSNTLTVKDIALRAYHGVYEHEREEGNDFLVSVSLDFDAVCAMQYDDLENTVNYAEVVDVVEREMAVPSALIENVAWRIANALLEAFPGVEGGKVAVTKVNTPIPVPTGGATFTLEFKK